MQRRGALAACRLLSWTTVPQTSKSLGLVGPGNYQKNLEPRAKEIDYEDNDTRYGCHGSVSDNMATVCATTREEGELCPCDGSVSRIPYRRAGTNGGLFTAYGGVSVFSQPEERLVGDRLF